MPIIKSAIKKLRQDKKRREVNIVARVQLKKTVRKARETHTAESLQAAFSMLDRAVKKNIIHKNKAARLKSNLAKHAATANNPDKTPLSA